MDNANFISLGGVTKKASFDAPIEGMTVGFRGQKPGERGPKVIGATKEERSRIAREIRNAAKKEKKKAKSDAKKARKLNGIMTRRATRNPEKYNKNKERNRLHAIDVERYKIRLNAVKQAEQLAAIHDPSGKSFNVSEVVLMEDGTVKHKKALERKAGEKGEKNEAGDKIDSTQGVNPERLKLLEDAKKPHISKNALKKKSKYDPKPVPPKPIIPENVEIPEGEENWLKLWDISDGEIEKRLHRVARQAGEAKRDIRRKQKEEARFRRMMKQKRRDATKMGVLFDPVQAKKDILGEQEDNDDSGSWDSDSDSDSDSGADDEVEGEKSGKSEEKKHKFNLDENQINAIVKKEKERVKRDLRKQEKAMGVYDKPPVVRTEEEQAALKEARRKRKEEKKVERKARKEAEEKEAATKPKGKENRKTKREQKKQERAEQAAKKAQEAQVSQEPQKNNEEVDLLGDIGRALDVASTKEPAPVEETKEEKKARKEKKKAEKAEKAAAKEAKEATPVAKEESPIPAPTEESKKRKRSKEEKDSTSSSSKKEHKRKKSSKATEEQEEKEEPAQAGGQWNADALEGTDERKSKFLRLLGAGKNAGAGEDGKGKESKGKKDIEKVQSELERQYEMGMKMKHDGGAKRRGLGA